MEIAASRSRHGQRIRRRETVPPDELWSIGYADLRLESISRGKATKPMDKTLVTIRSVEDQSLLS